MKKLSVIITAWNEATTIGKAIESVLDSNFFRINSDFEIILVAPDDETKIAAQTKIQNLGLNDKYIFIKDKCEGKPRALNMAFEKASGEILILTDGEVFFEKNAVDELLKVIESSERIGGVSGRPVALNAKKSGLMGYWAHMQADAVHKMRLDRDKSRVRFFPMSGYSMAIRNIKMKLPGDLFLDDAYISYVIFNAGYLIGYAPNALVKVKYPNIWKEFTKQKMRSLGGFEQLWKYNVITTETKSRSFGQEISYALFPLKYAKNPFELIYSLAYYPVRLYFWVQNRLRRDVFRKAKSIRDVYVRSESTK